MATPSESSITALLVTLGNGSTGGAAEQAAYKAVYPQLHALASRFMSSERAGHTLQPTALVNEAYLRLVDQESCDWKSRAHFFSIAARIMRRVLVDHARKRARAKRGSGRERVTLRDFLAVDDSRSENHLIDLVALDDALRRLESENTRLARVVELRVFSGLEITSIAAVLAVSERTVRGDWSFAVRWLARELASTNRMPGADSSD